MGSSSSPGPSFFRTVSSPSVSLLYSGFPLEWRSSSNFANVFAMPFPDASISSCSFLGSDMRIFSFLELMLAIFDTFELFQDPLCVVLSLPLFVVPDTLFDLFAGVFHLLLVFLSMSFIFSMSALMSSSFESIISVVSLPSFFVILFSIAISSLCCCWCLLLRWLVLRFCSCGYLLHICSCFGANLMCFLRHVSFYTRRCCHFWNTLVGVFLSDFRPS